MINNLSNNIIHAIDAISVDKNISKESIIKALEIAITSTAKKKYGINAKISTVINRHSGEIKLYKEVQKLNEKINCCFFKKKNTIKELLPLLETKRLNAVLVKKILTNKLKELEKEKIFEKYKNLISKILVGVVEKIETNRYIIKLDNCKAILTKEQSLKTDYYKLGDRIKVYLVGLNKKINEHPLIISRVHDNFVTRLFEQEIPEISDKIIKIKNVARDSGFKTKISVYSSDPFINPIGSCIGIKGVRIQSIIKELNGEKIDVIQWSENLATYTVNAFGAIRVSQIIIDEDRKKIEVVVPEENQSQAVGKKGCNIKLISKLIGLKIDITSKQLDLNVEQEQFNNIKKLLMRVLNLEEDFAELLFSKGFDNIEKISKVSISAMAKIEELDEEIAGELISRAKNYLNNKKNE